MFNHKNEEVDTKAGFVAVVGRPNAGKSTLLNHIVGEKLAMVSKKAQATRKRMNIIVMHDDNQIIFVQKHADILVQRNSCRAPLRPGLRRADLPLLTVLKILEILFHILRNHSVVSFYFNLFYLYNIKNSLRIV